MKAWLNSETVRYPLAVLCGVAWALAFPLPGWSGMAWLVPPLLWVGTFGLSRIEGFRFGYLAGLIHFLILLRWMRHMPVSMGAYAAWVALSAYCALFPAVWVWVSLGLFKSAASSYSGSDWSRVAVDYVHRSWLERAGLLVALSAAWVALEWGRSRLLTGFPWAHLGSSQWQQLPLIQIASITGVYGLSFLVCWCGLSLAGALLTLGFRPESRWSWTAETRLPLAITLMVMGWGFWEVMGYRRLEARMGARTVKLALVQPSVAQTLLWDPAEEESVFAKIESLSRQALALKPDVLVWPEGNFGLSQTNFLRMKTVLAGTKVDWVFCSDDIEENSTGFARFNAAFHYTAEGQLEPSYRKQRLVAFGEYVPLARWLPFLKWFTPIGEGFQPGNRPSLFRLAGGSVAAPVICFEDVFPHGIAGHVTSEIDFLLGLANDGWFLESAAQWQHSANAVFRAVENGVGLVRTCNNGVTGWWDARGTRRSTLADTEGGVYSPGILIIAVPVGLPWVETPYHRYGDVFAGLCTALAGWRMIRAKWRL